MSKTKSKTTSMMSARKKLGMHRPMYAKNVKT